MSCCFFRYLFPGGRPTPAPRRSTCLRLLLRSRRPTKEIPALRGRASGRRRKKEQSGADGRTAGGQQEDNNRTASVHPFISNHTPPTGAARPIRPLRPPPRLHPLLPSEDTAGTDLSFKGIKDSD